MIEPELSGRINRLWRVDLATGNQIERRRRDSHHGRGHAIEDDRTADHRRFGSKTPPPETLAEHRHGGRAWLLLLVGEGAPNHRLEPEDARQRRRDPIARKLFWFAAARQCVVVEPDQPKRLEARRPLPP